MSRLLDLVRSEVGYREKSGGYTKFGDWYGRTVETDTDYTAQPWCDMFLSWAAHELGYQEWVGQFAYTVAHARWFRANDAWGDEPQVGALVFYDWSGTGKVSGIDHVGIVTAVDGDRIHTVEGNIDGGRVKAKVRDTGKVVGYGYPLKVKAHLEEARSAAPGASTGAFTVLGPDGPMGALGRTNPLLTTPGAIPAAPGTGLPASGATPAPSGTTPAAPSGADAGPGTTAGGTTVGGVGAGAGLLVPSPAAGGSPLAAAEPEQAAASREQAATGSAGTAGREAGRKPAGDAAAPEAARSRGGAADAASGASPSGTTASPDSPDAHSAAAGGPGVTALSGAPVAAVQELPVPVTPVLIAPVLLAAAVLVARARLTRRFATARPVPAPAHPAPTVAARPSPTRPVGASRSAPYQGRRRRTGPPPAAPRPEPTRREPVRGEAGAQPRHGRHRGGTSWGPVVGTRRTRRARRARRARHAR